MRESDKSESPIGYMYPHAEQGHVFVLKFVHNYGAERKVGSHHTC